MALTDPITIPAGCGCCGGCGGVTVCGQIPADICLCLSGFTCPDPAVNFNGCYTLHQFADLTTGACPVWGYSAAFGGGTLSASVPESGFPAGALTMNGAAQLGTLWSNSGWSITPYCGSSDAGCVTKYDPNSLFNCSLSPPSATISNSLWRFSIFNGSGYTNYYNQSGTATLTFGVCPVYMAAPVMGMAPPPQLAAEPQTPTSKFAVVTLAVGQKGRDLLAVSGPLMEAAANRWGADFRVITGEDTAFNIGEKLRLYDYLKPYPAGYDRVFYLDADALILPTCPNPFDAFPAGRPYASDDLIGQPAAAEWIDRENREVCESQGWAWGGPFLKYWNSGVWLVDAAHAPAFAPPAKPYPVYHCSEQHAVNERMRANDYGVADFGRAWNYQWWVESRMAPPPGTHVLHFSGMDPISGTDPDAHARRLALMRQFATRKLPLECVHLGKREEFRAGCGGQNCLHHCDLGHPAVPGAYCQTCTDFAAD